MGERVGTVRCVAFGERHAEIVRLHAVAEVGANPAFLAGEQFGGGWSGIGQQLVGRRLGHRAGGEAGGKERQQGMRENGVIRVPP